MIQCRRVAFPLPHVPVTLRHRRSKPYVEAPKTLGQHLLRRRLTLGLTQPQAALQVSTSVETLANWEKDRTAPADRYYPGILRFLGYDLFGPPTTLGERLSHKRRQLGLSIKAAARLAEVDEGTFATWERDGKARQSHAAAQRFLAL